MNLVKVPYSIDGTGFTGVAVIEKYDPDTWEDELEKIRNRQEKLRTKGGTRIPVLTQEDTAEEEAMRIVCVLSDESRGKIVRAWQKRKGKL